MKKVHMLLKSSTKQLDTFETCCGLYIAGTEIEVEINQGPENWAAVTCALCPKMKEGIEGT